MALQDITGLLRGKYAIEIHCVRDKWLMQFLNVSCTFSPLKYIADGTLHDSCDRSLCRHVASAFGSLCYIKATLQVFLLGRLGDWPIRNCWKRFDIFRLRPMLKSEISKNPNNSYLVFKILKVPEISCKIINLHVT